MIEEPILAVDAPWKRRFRLPRIGVHLSRGNPNHALVVSNESGTYELYAYDLETNALKQATHRPSGTVYGMISQDGRQIFYMDDKKGNETGHIVRVPFEGGTQPEDLTPSIPDYTLVDPSTDGKGSQMGITIPGPDGFDSYVVDIGGKSPEEPRLICRSKKSTFGPVFSQDGKISVVVSSDRYGGLDFTLIAFETLTANRTSELADENSRIDPAEFSPIMGDQRLLASSNTSGIMRPLVWDLKTGSRTDLNIGSMEGDVVGLGWSPDAKKVLLCQTNKATTQLWLHDLETSATQRVRHPEGTVATACFRTNDSLLLTWQDSTNPTQLLAMNLRGDAIIDRYLTPKSVPQSKGWRSSTCRSSDGQEIQFWYAIPEGPGPFATIMDTHGGPTAAQFNVFAPRSQIWLDHGFAFATVNYRGSTTFGKEFEKKINGDLGHWEVEDMVAVRDWLIKSGISIPGRIFLTGWSYGGYLTLQGLSAYPELWAGGMGGVVVADWVTEYEEEPEGMRGYDRALQGGTPEEKPEGYRKSSPINYLDRLVAPLLIIQGRNDVRCPPKQVELYEAKAKELNKDVKVIWYDTGHAGSGADIELAITHHEAMLKWVYDVLGRTKTLTPSFH